jgi:alpha-amylase
LLGCLCGFNNDQWNEHTVTVQTSYPPNTRLHEYTGKYDTDIWTDWQGNATFTLPRNINGQSYLVFGLWLPFESYAWNPLATTQTFFGANDLTTPPAMTGTQTVGRVDIAQGAPIAATLTADTAHWSAQSNIRFALIGPDGISVCDGGLLSLTHEASYGHGVAQVGGFHSIVLTSIAMPLTGTAFAFTVTYTGAADFVPPQPVPPPVTTSRVIDGITGAATFIGDRLADAFRR